MHPTRQLDIIWGNTLTGHKGSRMLHDFYTRIGIQGLVHLGPVVLAQTFHGGYAAARRQDAQRPRGNSRGSTLADPHASHCFFLRNCVRAL